ncbi:MAG: DUF2306 domain-containing protein [Enhygromyxa sp.]
MTTKPDPQAIAPRWARPVVLLLAIILSAFAIGRYLSGLDGHKVIVGLLAPEYAAQHIDVLASHPGSELLHRLGGTILVATGLAQFSVKLRRARPKLHRICGYIYIVLALSAGLSGIYLGLRLPFSGVAETIPSVIFGVALIVVTVVALNLARQRRFEIHREWMVRSYALVLGPAVIRLLYLPTWRVFGLDQHDAMWVTFWVGWLTTWGFAELWIAARKRRLQALRGAKARATPRL